MKKITKHFFRKFFEHIVDVVIALIFLSMTCFIAWLWITNKKDNLDYQLVMPVIVTAGLFLAWVQFLSNKSTQRKEAALTYYPRPMELEKTENDIDMVIQFWSSSYAMASHEVKLMLDEEITQTEYKLCWERLSNQIKREIIEIYEKYNSRNLNTEGFDNSKSNERTDYESSFQYKEQYNDLIKEKFIDVRRKFHLYLNQIEGFCLALNKGNIDSNTAMEMYSYKLGNHFRKAKPYIDALRVKKGEPEIYIQFERVVDKWKH